MGQPGQTSLSERLRSIEQEIAAGQAESALARCQEVFTQYPRALAVQRVLGEAYLALRKPREALGALDRALGGDPEDVRACCARAIIYQMHGDPIAALAWYRRACDARPGDQALRATYREAAAQLGRPPYQPSRVGLARLYMRGSLFTHAIREWETLIAENSDLLEAQVGLVETLWRCERARDAEEWARRVLMNAPAAVKPLLIAGVLARASDRPTEAERYLQRAAELDPDHRIARALFADRAMGDASLQALFWGDEPINAINGAASSVGLPVAGRQRITNRFAEAPASAASFSASGASGVSGAALTGAPSLADLSAALSRPDLSANLSRPLSPVSTRPHNLPPEFHSMFKETENMLWGPDHSDPGAQPTLAMPTPPNGAPAGATGGPAPQASAAPSQPPQPPQPQQPMAASQSGRLAQPAFENSAQFVPPAIAESQFALGDTETRRAIRWVQWLQAQGARMRSDEPMRARPTGSLDALFGGAPVQGIGQGNMPPGAASMPFGSSRFAQLPVTSLPSTGPTTAAGPRQTTGPAAPPTPPPTTPRASEPSGPSGPLTIPMPQPQPEELRRMFAQLEPAAQAEEIVDADVVSARSVSPDEALAWTPASAQTPPAETVEPEGEPQADNAWPEALADAFEWPSQPGLAAPDAPRGAPAGSSGSSGSGAANGQGSPDLTLEALEGVHEASGYQPFTLEPGALAAFTDAGEGQRGPAPASEAARALDEFFQGPEVPPEPHAPIEPPPPDPVADLPEPPAEPEPAAAPAISPTDYPARLEAARGLREQGALDDALVEYRALLRSAPDLLPDVLADLQAALDEQPEHPELHRLVSDARIRQGDYLSALESLNRSVTLSQPTDE